METSTPVSQPFFEVKLPLFEGPIDLLLHLVKLNELPIEKISLAQLANQYLDCINLMRGYDLEVAGEYLVIAATLLSIKSSVLLKEPVELVPDEDGNLVNPHDELLRRLREAAVYHDAAASLRDWPKLGSEVFAGSSILDKIPAIEGPLAPHSTVLLQRAFDRVLKRLKDSNEKITISFDPISIVERMREVLDKLEHTIGNKLAFGRLVEDVLSKSSVVGTFVALLELCKRGAISILQNEGEDDIYVQKVGALTEITSEFDEEVEVVNT